jgi:hypothetical protein
MKQILCLLIVTIIYCTGAVADKGRHLYSTGSIMEADRAASAWLIKRYVDPKAEFIFFKDGQLITQGTAFDTPDARFSRTHNLSTFEVLIRHFNIDDPKVTAMAAAIHQIEINYWAGVKNAQAADLARQTNAIIKANPDPAKCLKKCFDLFDRIVSQVSTNKE